MAKSLMSKKRAYAISNGILLICLGALIFTNAWWPHILLAIWITLFSRQYLCGRIYYALLSTIIILGLYVTALMKFDFEHFLPVILVVAGIFVIFREYYFADDTNGEDKSQEILDDVDI